MSHHIVSDRAMPDSKMNRAIETGTVQNDTPTDNAHEASPAEASRKKAKTPLKGWRRPKLDLSKPILMFSFKGSLPMVICFAIFQADAVAHRYATFFYVIPMIALFTMCNLPRAKFLQSVLLMCIATCISAAVSLFGIWCGVKAREHTQGKSTERYNSSQSAVCAIWLFADIWFASMLRNKIPSLQNPIFINCTLTMILLTYGPRFEIMDQGITAVIGLLEIFFIAFGITTGVSLLIFPLNTRTILFKQQTGFIVALKTQLTFQTECFRSLDAATPKSTGSRKIETASIEAIALKKAAFGLKMQYTRLIGDLPFAKREIGFGKLNANDLSEVNRLFHSIMIPVIGISTVIETLDGFSHRWDQRLEEDPEKEGKFVQQKDWHNVMVLLHEPFAALAEAMNQGLHHVGLRLELIPRSKGNKADIETKGDIAMPGDDSFAKYMDQKLHDFQERRNPAYADSQKEKDLCTVQDSRNPAADRKDQEHMYFVLYTEELIYDMALAIHELVLFADSKVNDGTMKTSRLIYPDYHQTIEWFESIWSNSSEANVESASDGQQTRDQSRLYTSRKDPEHLPPANAWEKYSNHLRAVPRLLKSPESAFGFRVACATLSAGILAFLRQTWQFYYDQRLIWALIVVAIGWYMGSGQSVFSLVGRVVGTLLAMVICYVAWYIVDGYTAGVIVFIWLAFFCLQYALLRHPQFIGPLLICQSAIIAIVGVELQAQKLGKGVYEATGSVIYPIYEMAPYRAFVVICGCVISFFWTVFPYPVTDHSLLRRELGSALFLLTEYYNCCQSTINARLLGTDGDPTNEASPGHRLRMIHNHIFDQLMRVLPSLHSSLNFQKYEFPIGGAFPRARYEIILSRTISLLDYMMLLAHATNKWVELVSNAPTHHTSDQHLRALVESLDASSRQVSLTLALLSSAVEHGEPLPASFQAPQSFAFGPLWVGSSGDLYDSCMIESAYSACPVIQIMSELICRELGRLIGDVRELVGEINFEVAPGPGTQWRTGKLD